MHTLVCRYNNYAVVDSEAVVTLWNNEVVSSYYARDKYAASQLEFLEWNVNIILLVPYNELDSFKAILYKPVERCNAVSERVLSCADILEDLVDSYPLGRNYAVESK